jgi:DeoR/GlpR family transcriptional regulator of sugar metabolism
MAKSTEALRPSDLSRKYEVSRNTISRRLNALVHKKILKRYGKGAGVFYQLSGDVN